MVLEGQCSLCLLKETRFYCSVIQLPLHFLWETAVNDHKQMNKKSSVNIKHRTMQMTQT